MQTGSDRPGPNGRKTPVDTGKLKEDIAELTRVVGDIASRSAAGAREVSERQLGEIETTIRRNPTQSMLVAAGIGFVLGLLATRGS